MALHLDPTLQETASVDGTPKKPIEQLRDLVAVVSFQEIVSLKLEQFLSRLPADHGQDVYALIVADVESQLLRLALEKCGGNKTATAKFLGINRATLAKKMSLFGIE